MSRRLPPLSSSPAEELCAKAFRLSVVAVIGVVLVGMIAVAGVYPHAAGEASIVIREAGNALRGTANASESDPP